MALPGLRCLNQLDPELVACFHISARGGMPCFLMGSELQL